MPITDDDIHQIIEEIWSLMLQLDIKRAHEPSPLNREQHFLTGCIQITGEWEGSVTLDCSQLFAHKASAIMFNTPTTQLKIEDIKDTLSELTNMIGGNVKTLLPAPCYLSLPTVIEGYDYRVSFPGRTLLNQLSFSCGNDNFWVTLWKKSDKAT